MSNQKKQEHKAFNPNSPAYIEQRAIIQAEINSHPVTLDKSVFAKTAAEKAELKILKKEYKDDLKKKKNSAV